MSGAAGARFAPVTAIARSLPAREDIVGAAGRKSHEETDGLGGISAGRRCLRRELQRDGGQRCDERYADCLLWHGWFPIGALSL